MTRARRSRGSRSRASRAGERLCLADYFLPLESGKRDVAAFQIVTVGAEADRSDRETASRAATTAESFFSHGLSVSSAEGLAEYVHQRDAQRAGHRAGEQGKRYSWGYPACPDLEPARDRRPAARLGTIGIA